MNASVPDAHLPRLPYLLTGIVASVLIVIVTIMSINDEISVHDAQQNMAIAFNVAKYGVFSADEHDSLPLRATLLREPLYPAYLAGVLRAFVDTDTLTYTCLVEEAECEHVRLLLKRAIIPVYVALMWAFAAAAYWITRRLWLTWILLALLGIVDYFWYNDLMTELPAALFLLLHSAYLYRVIQPGTATRDVYIFATLSGLSLGALVLIKAIFLYWALLLVLAALVIFLMRGRCPQHLRYAAVLTVLSTLLLITPWLVRNYVVFGEFKIAGRDSNVLSVRAEFSYMTGQEYLAQFAYFAPQGIQPILLTLFDEAHYSRFPRLDEDGNRNLDSFYWRSRLGGYVTERALEEYGSLNDSARTRAALSIIRENWMQHTALTVSFAYRGSFVKIFRHLAIDRQIAQFIYVITYGVSLFFVPALLGVALVALARRRWALLAFLLPAMYSFAIHAAITHYIPRYSAPLVPVFLIALGVVVVGVVGQVWDGKSIQ